MTEKILTQEEYEKINLTTAFLESEMESQANEEAKSLAANLYFKIIAVSRVLINKATPKRQLEKFKDILNKIYFVVGRYKSEFSI